MSENNPSVEPADGGNDIERLKAKNGEIIGKNKELKEQNQSLMSKLEQLESTISNVGKLFGVQEGEDVGLKAKEMIEAKEKEKFEAMSETEKLAHRLASLEDEIKTSKLEKEKAQKEALGLRIDDKLKNAFASNGVADSNALSLALDAVKARNPIQGLDGDNLLLDNGQLAINDLVSGFLNENPYLVKNPAKGGNGISGAIKGDANLVNDAKANEIAKKTGSRAGIISQKLAMIRQQ